MKHLKLAALLIAAAVGTSACADATDPVSPVSPGSLDAVALTTVAPTNTLDGRRLSLALPTTPWISHEAGTDLISDFINGDVYQCSTTAVFGWINGRIADVQGTDRDALLDLVFGFSADLLVMYEALYFQSADTPQYFGVDGDYTKIIEKTDKDARRFWDIPTDGIEVVGMHGDMLLDHERVARAYHVLFGLPAPLADAYASAVRSLVLSAPSLERGNHPYFSFNAFAIDFPEGASIDGTQLSDKIVMGDGMLAGYEALGYGDVAPQAIFMHEFAHHVQFAKNLQGDPFVPEWEGDPAEYPYHAENTRFGELMADAMSAYYLTHARGATMNQKRVEQFLAAFFQIGDCSFTSSGHHGTPNQRMAAARFGFQVADDAHKQGHILSSQEFYDLFVAAYPELIAPDAI